jgi:hypothetical protein
MQKYLLNASKDKKFVFSLVSFCGDNGPISTNPQPRLKRPSMHYKKMKEILKHMNKYSIFTFPLESNPHPIPIMLSISFSKSFEFRFVF